jgi:dTDP-4-dehydrorhamnose reductase
VVDSEKVTPTWTYELAQQMVRLSRSESFGLYHATAEGSCSWYDFARKIFAVAGMPVAVEVADPNEFPAKVQRPKYSVLENTGLKAIGVNSFRPWQDGLSRYLDSRPASGVTAPKSLALASQAAPI